MKCVCAILLSILYSAKALRTPAPQLDAGFGKGGAMRTVTGGNSATATALTDLLANILSQARQTVLHEPFNQRHGRGLGQGYYQPRMSHMRNSGGRGNSFNNNILPYLFYMGNDNMWPMLFLNNGQQGQSGNNMSPMMMYAIGHDIF